MSDLLVSICCTTYNHKRYISQAIEGFLMQRTSFSIEIIIHDDASTDGTTEIVKAYADQYPHRIIPIFQKENQWSQGKRPSPNYVLPKARGKYIALCEGDDYWTDPLKLQRQIDFLEANIDYSLCFHNAKVIYEDTRTKSHDFTKLKKNDFYIEDIISNNWFIPTQSIVFRRQQLEIPNWYNYIFGGDLALLLILATKGKIYGINEVMSIYRINNGSVSSNLPVNYTSLKKIETLSFFNLHTNFIYNSLIQKAITEINKSLYFNMFFSRPLYIRILSFDYYAFKLKELLGRQKN